MVRARSRAAAGDVSSLGNWAAMERLQGKLPVDGMKIDYIRL